MLIEGVGVAMNVYMYRQQQAMMEEQMALEKKKIEKMMRIQKGDAWHDDIETKKDVASLQQSPGGMSQKSYSF